jgi:uncharacterized protein DUF5076
MPRELPVPPEALDEDKALEFMRGWIVNKILYCSLNIGVYRDREPAFWGMFLSDVAHHVADAMFKERGWNKEQTIEKIKATFNAEIESPSDEFSGDFIQ